MDSVVHDNADSGSPLRVGSTRPSSAGTRPGPFSVSLLRPAPSRRIRPDGTWPDSNSATPSWILEVDAPDARATAIIPP